MKVRRNLRGRSRTGFTLLESVISLAIFTSLGYSLAVVLRVGKRSHQTVSRVAAEDRSVRKAVESLTDDLRTSRDTTVTVTPLADGNHQVQFMLPLVVGAATTWGVHDRSLGSDEASQNRVGWSLRYTTRDRATGNGGTIKQLLRQIVDDAQVVQREQVLAEGLRRGASTPPGFRMVKTGDVWEITLTTEGQVEDKTVFGVVFHVRTRN